MGGELPAEKYAGEGYYNTEEYARPADIDNRQTRYEVGREGDYYPTPPRGWRG